MPYSPAARLAAKGSSSSRSASGCRWQRSGCAGRAEAGGGYPGSGCNACSDTCARDPHRTR